MSLASPVLLHSLLGLAGWVQVCVVGWVVCVGCPSLFTCGCSGAVEWSGGWYVLPLIPLWGGRRRSQASIEQAERQSGSSGLMWREKSEMSEKCV